MLLELLLQEFGCGELERELGGTRVLWPGESGGRLLDSAHRALRVRTLVNKPQSGHKLTQILQGATFDHAPPMINGRRIKLRMAHAGGNNPPIIVIHGNQTSKVPANYKRYLEKTFRRELELSGTPIRIEFKSGDNPYEEKRENLSKRQAERKLRIKRQSKKK